VNQATLRDFVTREIEALRQRASDPLLGDSAEARRFHAVVDRLETRVCYCSLYEECWRASSEEPAPVKVDACTDEPNADFAQ